MLKQESVVENKASKIFWDLRYKWITQSWPEDQTYKVIEK